MSYCNPWSWLFECVENLFVLGEAFSTFQNTSEKHLEIASIYKNDLTRFGYYMSCVLPANWIKNGHTCTQYDANGFKCITHLIIIS